MFDQLERISRRPAPFGHYTASELWTDEHLSRQMLSFHLDPHVDLSSRNHAFIDRSVQWLAGRFGLDPNTHIADFGCGPGLYATRFARLGARVTGIDFSARSIEYARRIAIQEGLPIQYVHQDYLAFDSDQRFNLIVMIMCDFCALGPRQRARLLGTFGRLLAPGGSLVLDAYTLRAFDEREAGAGYAKDQLDGFWSPRPYYGFVNTFKYEREKVVLDKYTIVEPERTRTFYNWLQHYSIESLTRELDVAGLEVDALHADVAGGELTGDSPEMAVVASRR